jgi:hypothetical protein
MQSHGTMHGGLYADEPKSWNYRGTSRYVFFADHKSDCTSPTDRRVAAEANEGQQLGSASREV